MGWIRVKDKKTLVNLDWARKIHVDNHRDRPVLIVEWHNGDKTRIEEPSEDVLETILGNMMRHL